MDNDESKDYISNKLSLYLLTSHLICIAAGILLGFYLDRIKKIWPMLALAHICLITFLVLFICYTPTQDDIYSKTNHHRLGMTIGFIGISALSTSSIIVNNSLVYKCSAKCTLSRGFFLGVNAFCGSTGVLVINGVGGHIEVSDKRNPFIFCLGGECFSLLLISILACCKKLKS